MYGLGLRCTAEEEEEQEEEGVGGGDGRDKGRGRGRPDHVPVDVLRLHRGSRHLAHYFRSSDPGRRLLGLRHHRPHLRPRVRLRHRLQRHWRRKLQRRWNRRVLRRRIGLRQPHLPGRPLPRPGNVDLWIRSC